MKGNAFLVIAYGIFLVVTLAVFVPGLVMNLNKAQGNAAATGDNIMVAIISIIAPVILVTLLISIVWGLKQ